MTKRKPARRKPSSLASITRRLGLTFIITVVGALQATSCSIQPVNTSSSNQSQPQTGAFAACPQHFPGPAPVVATPGRQRQLCFDAFAVLHSGESKTPLYVVERLTSASIEVGKSIKRKDRFYPEARLPFADRSQLADYSGSGYDRGHMAPTGDMPTEPAKAQSFSLANMVPQASELNQRAWSQIEQATRKYALRAPGEVFVFTGPFFDKQHNTIGPGHVWVPAATWKLVYTPADGRSWAYWMNNDIGPHSIKPITYQQLVDRMGVTFLPGHRVL